MNCLNILISVILMIVILYVDAVSFLFKKTINYFEHISDLGNVLLTSVQQLLTVYEWE